MPFFCYNVFDFNSKEGCFVRPLSDILRPDSIEEMVGQQHLLGEGKLLRAIVEKGEIPNMIFYGPSGVGKTTLARILSEKTDRKLYKLNATTASISDIKEIINNINPFTAPNGCLLYLDEIQYFNKKQQQTLLEFIENGSITLIASTTENPYFYVYNAILSRCTVFEFKPVAANDMIPFIKRAIAYLEEQRGYSITCSEENLKRIAYGCGGDVRKCCNCIEIVSMALTRDHGEITEEMISEASQRSGNHYDKDGDYHYDILSAFQKSIRGSDPDAALVYLSRLLEAGNLIAPCRRLMVIAAEDIGLAYPQAISIVKSCVDCAQALGLPEARIPLAEAVILLATAPKSNSAIMAVDAAMEDVRNGKGQIIPADIQDAHYGGAGNLGRGKGYLYPHSFPNHYVNQNYMPEDLKGRKYYQPGDNKTETASKEYWRKIKEQT
ncbi:MAG: replication-associated recombination protein A [Clostridia bacterium]|nr:replication-associated recombination protein A [Clostridia bacterium]